MSNTDKTAVERVVEATANMCIIATTGAVMILALHMKTLGADVRNITAKMTDVADATSGKLVEAVKDVDASEVGAELTTKAKEIIRDYGKK